MEDPEPSGKRMPAPGKREAAERETEQATRATADAPAPRPVPRRASDSPRPKAAPGVPMAGRSFASKEAGKASRARPDDRAPPPAYRTERPRPPAAPKAAELEEDFELDEDFDLDMEENLSVSEEEDEVYYEEEDEDEAPSAKPSSPDTPSRIYSTRRALAEQVNREVGERPSDEETKGMAALREKREIWKKIVETKEQEGKSPYISRWAKVSFFPMLYMVVSLSLLKNITYEYGKYYSYEPIYLLIGFVMGAVLVVAFSVLTMLRAKRVKRPILLKSKSSWVGVIVFIGVSVYLAMYYGLAFAWMFSIGFLGAGLLVVLLGFAIEKTGKGTFWVKDATEGSDKRWLEFVPMG